MSRKNRKYKRTLITADWHCGHQVGLLPSNFKVTPISKHPRQEKFEHVRKEVWRYFVEALNRWKPIDIAFYNGDLIEGKGVRSGGTELIASDRKVQCEIAACVIRKIGATHLRFTYGTPAHTGTEEDWEDVIADEFHSKIGSHEWYDVNGIIFDLKHKISSSTIPHGRHTPLGREILWNRLWYAEGKQPKADILIRSHVHYYDEIYQNECYGRITPALQGFGSKYGSRECSGTVDIGFLVVDIYNDGEIRWHPEIIVGSTQIAEPEKF